MSFNTGFFIQQSVIVPPVPYSMVFDGTNENIIVPHTAALDLNPALPITGLAWIKATNYAFAGYKWIVSKRDVNYKGYLMAINGGNLYVYFASSIGSIILVRSSGFTFVNNEWYDVGFTWVGGTSWNDFKLYVNGVEVSKVLVSGGAIGASLSTVNDMYIGRDLIEANYFAGSIGDIRFWQTLLTPSELLAEYNAKMQVQPVQPLSLVYHHSAADSLFSTQWVFPYSTNIQSSYSVNMEFTDRSADIPV